MLSRMFILLVRYAPRKATESQNYKNNGILIQN